MTIYTKPRAELFAQDAPPSEIKPFTAWLRGLGIAFDETNGYPEMESFNGLLQVLNGYIKYLEQNGFAEWSSTLEYPIGAGVRVGAVWYRAKAQNTNKPPATSQNEWEVFLNAAALTYDNPIYIENNVVKIRAASETQTGVSRFANATEIANKSNVSATVNPANVSQMFGRTQNQITLPDGTVMKFGVATVSGDSNLSLNFPSPFQTACLNAQATLNSSSFDVVDDAGCGVTWSKTGLVLRSGCAVSVNISWFAIGY
ncbi:MAG: hypothetical protein RSE18_02320 [Acinetobacter sp.]